MAGWYTPDEVSEVWADAPDAVVEYLQQMLDVAQGAVLSYANTKADGYDPDAEPLVVPAKYRQGQLMVLQSMWNTQAQNPSGDFDSGGWGLTMSVPALNSAVKQVLRPRTGGFGPVG